MLLSDIQWGEKKIFGIAKSHYSISKSNFVYNGVEYVASQCFRRSGFLLGGYKQSIVITKDIPGTFDDAVIHSIAYEACGISKSKSPLIHPSPRLNQNTVILIEPNKDLEIENLLQKI